MKLTNEAEGKRARFRSILKHTLAINDIVDWNILKDRTKFVEIPYDIESPTKPRIELSPKPTENEDEILTWGSPLGMVISPVLPNISLVDKLLGRRRKIKSRHAEHLLRHEQELARKSAAKKEKYEAMLRIWNAAKATADAASAEWHSACSVWETGKLAWEAQQNVNRNEYLNRQREKNKLVDDLEAKWRLGESFSAKAAQPPRAAQLKR